tara:strand:- start:49 stop:318 length:270 start_codon:yes stop_codon:yes gene_type:complete
MLPNLFNGGRLSNEKNQFLDFKVRGHKMGRSDGFDDSKKSQHSLKADRIRCKKMIIGFQAMPFFARTADRFIDNQHLLLHWFRSNLIIR